MSTIQVTCAKIEKWREAAKKDDVAILIINQHQGKMTEHLDFSYLLTGLEEDGIYKISLIFHPEPNKTFQKKMNPIGFEERDNEHGPIDFTQILDFCPKLWAGKYWMGFPIYIPLLCFQQIHGNETEAPNNYTVMVKPNWKYHVKIRVQKHNEPYVDYEVPEQEFIVLENPQPVNNEQGSAEVVPPIKDTMSNIEVTCTTVDEWKEKGGGDVDEDTLDLDRIIHPKYAAIILNRFPPENLGFEYEVIGLEEDCSYEMELLFDPNPNAHLKFSRHTEDSFKIRPPKSGEQVDKRVMQICHRQKAQPGSYWKKSRVNFDKLCFRKENNYCEAPLEWKHCVDLISRRMYQVKLRIRKDGDEEKICKIDHQYFVACYGKYRSTKNKTNADSGTDTDTFEHTEAASQKRTSQGMMPSTSDNLGIPLAGPPKRQAFDTVPSTGNPFQQHAFGALWPAVNPTQLQPMNIDLKSVQSLLGGIPGPFSQQGAGPLINTQQVNIEQRQPNMMPSTSDNSELSLSDIEDLLEQQRATGTLLTVEQVAVYANLLAAQALTSNPVQQQQMNRIIQRLLGGYPGLFSHEGAAQVLNPPPVNIVQRPVVVNPVEEPPINPEPEQEPPRHPEQD
ncbi:unnamed protein product [Caenorhabditis nigoni]